MIKASDKDVAHDEVDQANDAGPEAKLGDLVEEVCAPVHQVVEVVLVHVTASQVKVWSENGNHGF